MIKLTRLNGTTFVLNGELIEIVEETPDTVISTVNGKKLVVKESVDTVVEKMVEYKKRLSYFKQKVEDNL